MFELDLDPLEMEAMNSGESSMYCQNLTVLNKTNEMAARMLLYDATSSGLITIALPIIGTIGCLINASFLFVVFRIRRMRTITNAYLCNLAASDILFLLTATAAGSLQYHSSPVNFDKYQTGIAGCVLFNFLIYTFFFASIALVTLVSLERYYAICSPLKQWLISGKARTAKLLLVTWMISASMAALNVPAFIVLKPLCVDWPDTEDFQDFPDIVGDCKPVTPWFTQVSCVSRMIPFFVAMIGNIYMYSRIILTLKRRFIVNPNDAAASGQAINHVQSVRRQVSAMLIATGTAFFLCQVSTQVYVLLGMVTSLTGIRFFSPQQRVVILWINRMLLYANSTINPIVYNVTNQRYRSAFNTAIIHCDTHMTTRQRGSRRPYMERGDTAQQTIHTSLM
ncbi:growth hormone secretagogue receptor type 1-like [Patiria miniata]|uniref:G-protein coupled receptors family 1 profile domain-containing protein n=1 Tax=Patiria miniata TaxID=46514 RepID=A0A914B0B2_PATMI|nr:growth hormone secretagogue receptor type 1-like [Patiria miniata]